MREGSTAEAAPPDVSADPGETSEPFEPSLVTCDDGVAAVARGLARADESLGDREVLRLCTMTQLAASRGPACAARVRDQLASAQVCRRTYGAVSSCVVSSPNFAAQWTRQLFDSASPDCRMRLVSSLHQARVVDLRLVKTVASFALAQAKESRRSRTFLALGSLERSARAEGPVADDAVGYVDALLARELHGSSGPRRAVMLEAAGNAACAACLDDVRSSLRTPDPVLRRSAIAALRFHDGAPELDALCRALADDASEIAREQAAWSLRWSGSNESPRAACLERAARLDPTESVRLAATQSLVALSERSPAAVLALADLSDGELEKVAMLVAASDSDGPSFDPLGQGETP